MNKQIITKNKILNIAEALFAEHGFNETSLREITAEAKVNLASVNYHFGSKKSLIEAVFERYMEVFTNSLMNEMAMLEKDVQNIKTLEVLQTLIHPLMAVNHIRPDGSSVFMKLLGRAYSETQGHLRRFVMQKYSHVFLRFTRLLHKANPELSSESMFWRLHFMMGSFIFTLAGHEALQEISQSDFDRKVDIETILTRLIAFLAAGFEYSREQSDTLKHSTHQ
ncbi:MAG: TetR family transcriptional regulator [Gammaproteobacteria bacterium]|nr:TetR family transcriptional regulator [Gammaproteobacteria bacterium]MDH5630217.1 TetR family transcriptional regulator [Gammaproteobacteria bacterium]